LAGRALIGRGAPALPGEAVAGSLAGALGQGVRLVGSGRHVGNGAAGGAHAWWEGTGWNRMESDGFRWNRMESDGFRWNRMEPDGIRWNRMESDAMRCDAMRCDAMGWDGMGLEEKITWNGRTKCMQVRVGG
jgi:pentapeptide MXKDX repeat protein